MLGGIAQHLLKLGRGKRLDDETARALCGGCLDVVNGAVGAEHHYKGIGPLGKDRRDQVDAIATAQFDIEKHQIRLLARAHLHHIGTAGRLADLSALRSEEHTSELQSLMRLSYAVFCL